MSNVYLGCPLYNWQTDFRSASCATQAASRLHAVHVKPISTSRIPLTCNSLWCDALNLKAKLQLEWFAMVHADLESDDWFIDTLISEADRVGADLLAVNVPIKDGNGIVSTAIHRPGCEFAPLCRLSLSQIHHENFPRTFDINAAADALERLPAELRITDVPRSALLTNTGCMICRIDKPWAERVWFDDLDGIECKNGKWQPKDRPEDWRFSKRVADEGGKVMATSLVRVKHYGQFAFDSSQTWGKPRDT